MNGLHDMLRLLTFVLFFTVLGCAPREFSGNNASLGGLSQSFEKGISKKIDVREALGQPDDVLMGSNARVTWLYYNLRMRDSAANWIPIVNMAVGGNNIDLTTNTVKFDGTGTFQSFKMETITKYRSMYKDFAKQGSIDSYPATGRVRQEMKLIGSEFDPKKIMPTEHLQQLGFM